jgi:hypothetical protein
VLLEILDTVLDLEPQVQRAASRRPRVEVQGPTEKDMMNSVDWKKNVGAPVALLVLLRAGSSEVLGLAAQVR